MVSESGARRSGRAFIVAIVGSALVSLVGLIMLASSLLAPVSSFGWFAYSPLSGRVFPSPEIYIVSQLTVVGAIAMGIGLIGLSLVVGYLLGRRRGASGHTTTG